MKTDNIRNDKKINELLMFDNFDLSGINEQDFNTPFESRRNRQKSNSKKENVKYKETKNTNIVEQEITNSKKKRENTKTQNIRFESTTKQTETDLNKNSANTKRKSKLIKEKNIIEEYKVTGDYKKEMSARNKRAERSRTSRQNYENNDLGLDLTEETPVVKSTPTKGVQAVKVEEVEKALKTDIQSETKKTVEKPKAIVSETKTKATETVKTQEKVETTEVKTEEVKTIETPKTIEQKEEKKEVKKMAENKELTIEELKANLEKAKAELTKAKAEAKEQKVASLNTDIFVVQDQFNKASDFVVATCTKFAEQVKIAQIKGESTVGSFIDGALGESKIAENVTNAIKYVSGKLTAGVTLGATPATIAVGATKGIFLKVVK
jgi:hypothetical protein